MGFDSGDAPTWQQLAGQVPLPPCWSWPRVQLLSSLPLTLWENGAAYGGVSACMLAGQSATFSSLVKIDHVMLTCRVMT